MWRAGERALLVVGVSVALLGLTPGCASRGPSSPQDKVFYQTNDSVTGTAAQATEWAYPPLDAPATATLPPYDGVSLFDGTVLLSRPRTWGIRAAGGPPNHRYVEYVSPLAFLFAIYEVDDSIGSWGDDLTEYESEAAKAGAEFLSKRVPMATQSGQGFAFVLRRTMTGARGPLVNYVHEYVVHGEHRIVLVQIVHHGEPIDGASAELRRVIETLEVP